MALQFNKELVIERLKKHLEQALLRETNAHVEHTKAIVRWLVDVKAWREKAIEFYTGYVNSQKNDSVPDVNVYDVPHIPNKPKQQALTDATSLRHYIGQVECLEGDVITLSKGLLDGVGRYLSSE